MFWDRFLFLTIHAVKESAAADPFTACLVKNRNLKWADNSDVQS